MLPRYAVNHRTVIGFCVFLLIAGGIYSYKTLGRLEDPEFTIKTALVVTLYPGAPAQDVERLVTDEIERAAQQVKGFEKVRSISKPGVSFVFVDLYDSLTADQMKESWHELRNKVSEVRLDLPVEALPSLVKDDFAEVYGIVLALYGDGYTKAELRDMARDLQKELLLVDEVSRVELWGVPDERVEVEISQARMKELNVHPWAVVWALQSQNIMADTGNMTIGGQKIRISPAGSFKTIEEIEDLVLPDGKGADFLKAAQQATDSETAKALLAKLNSAKGEGTRQIRLRDIATVKRVMNDEPSSFMRTSGKDAIVLAISPKPNGNVIRMGDLIHDRLDQLKETWPAGYDCEIISYQPDNVKKAIHGFIKNLREAIIIVTLVVMVAMGWRSGILITSSLLIVILGTFCAIAPLGVVLQRTSLGALIIALGILVDDAVVVGDLILVRMQRGMDRKEACIEGTRRAANQLLGATVVGALAFWPVYLSADKTGQYAGCLFIVLGVSLIISWFVAMLQTPVVYYIFVKNPPKTGIKDPHGGPVYQTYRRALEFVLHHKTLTLAAMVGLLILSGYGFTHVQQIFFPRAQRTQFMIDYWLPEGTSVNTVSEDVRKIERYLLGKKQVVNVGSFIGGGPPRFYLPYEPELPNSSYAQLVVNTHTIGEVDEIIGETEQWVRDNFPQAETRAQRFALGPTTKQEVEVRFSGKDPHVLRKLADQARKILEQEPTAKYVRDDWRQMVPTWSPEFSQTKGARTMTSRSETLLALRWATSGIPAATFGEGENLLPIIVRSTPAERNNTDILDNTPVWGHSLESVPLSQITGSRNVIWEFGQIHRRNRIPTITVGADPRTGTWAQLQKKIQPKMESIELPEGYRLEWGGQMEQSEKSSKTLLGKLPIALIFMAIIVVALFNSLKQPLIITLTFPLAMIGITFGMLICNKPFGFMALIGAMSLLGMMVRNGVVLMDQIDEELAKGDSPYEAIVCASVERMRPVTVAALTVIVGMIPLLSDPLFDSMATAIMFGLIFATVLTLFFVPVLYMIFFRVKLPEKQTSVSV